MPHTENPGQQSAEMRNFTEVLHETKNILLQLAQHHPHESQLDLKTIE
ncbi:hypothetical protein LRY65_00945 [Candidatus Woesebacteria bacterium]|nr:hypothetical protein [Candidatus Woesebacteria bacterium]MCD8507652.1 hypothetical protein [Candidatus Woesebacteria bacterium]MCD8526763.1 hypothetical protein [Candidatus Woesebacteria bacterium]MCD8546492.1 hypothetical protein [Candidatus Woesebacteria bacterium]